MRKCEMCGENWILDGAEFCYQCDEFDLEDCE